MPEYFDDNFGHWDDMDDPEMQEFYDEVQSTNVLKTCSMCGEKVNIQPQYDKCGSCADKLESGWAC
jgi:hypothetical protein